MVSLWNRISGPVYLMAGSAILFIINMVLEAGGRYLTIWFIPVRIVGPILFVAGVIWLIITLVSKPKKAAE
jgi:hypothetical protein